VGLHWIRLVATDSGSASGSDSIQLRITEQVENLPPTATILEPANNSSFEYGDPVTFEGTGTDPEDGDLQGPALTWTSDLGGSIGSGTSFTISSLSEGFHLITLTVFDSQAAFNQDSITIEITEQHVENLPPNAVLTGPAEAMAQTDVTLDGSGSWDADGTVVRYVFDFGDGTPVQDGSDGTAVHAFQNDGAYTVTLTVYDDDNASGVATHPILITPYQHLPEVVEDSRDRLGSRCTLGFTPDNRPLIAYRNDTHPAVRLAEQQPDGSFIIQTIEGFGLDVGGDAGEQVDLATDSGGTIHLAYLFKDPDGNTSLRYAQGFGSSFDLGLIDQTDDRGEFPLTISMNPATQKPEILYAAQDRSSVKHAVCQGDCTMLSSWTLSTVYTETRGRGASYNRAFPGGFVIQIDGTRHATIGARYEDTGYDDWAEIIYAVHSGSSWDLSESVIDLRIQAYYYDDNDASRMTLDQFGQPLVIHDYGVYHRSAPSDWPLSEVESFGLNYFDIAFDPSLETAYLLNRHSSQIEIIAENERSYWLYESLGPQDEAQPEIQIDLTHQPRACFARDGNIILY
jgi:PKD repeat protein